MIQNKLTRLDESSLQEHIALDNDDYCLFWRIYTPRRGYGYSDTNQMIFNLKADPNAKQRKTHKESAIETIAAEMVTIIPERVFLNYTFVPIPPSKIKGNPDYDRRMISILEIIKETRYPTMDLKELILTKESKPSDHTSSERQSVNDIQRNYCLEPEFIQPTPEKIIIFDDILASGRHYKASQKLLLGQYPLAKIIGLFIARAVNFL